MTAPLLQSLENLPAHVERATYDRDACEPGIVHLGLGAFHRAHQAVYTDVTIEASADRDWRIFGASMRDTRIPKLVEAQNGLYSVLARRREGTCARVISCLARAVSAAENPALLLERMSSSDTRIVSLTVTEKGYGIDRSHGGVDLTDPIIAHDMRSSSEPKGTIGFIVHALNRRRQSRVPPFTVLCCDNLPDNGSMVRRAVLDFARHVERGLADWIEEAVSFPSTMVDRITPAQTPETLALAENLTGHRDQLAVETEAFRQWVIEDDFSMGRPEWEAAGALFTNDVAPYETMKLRMLNGAHSMLAYGGFLAGHAFVRDAMADDALAIIAKRHMQAAAQTLPAMPGIDLTKYADDLLERFANPQIAHETYQIATDGSQKLPQRMFEPALVALESNRPLRPFAFATALWMHYCRGSRAEGDDYVIHDPLASVLQEAANRQDTQAVIGGFSDIPGLIPRALSGHSAWSKDLSDALTALRETGVPATLRTEALRAASDHSGHDIAGR